MSKVKITDVSQIMEGKLEIDRVRQFYLENMYAIYMYAICEFYSSTSHINDVSHEFKNIPKGALEDFKIGLEVFIDELIEDGILIRA